MLRSIREPLNEISFFVNDTPRILPLRLSNLKYTPMPCFASLSHKSDQQLQQALKRYAKTSAQYCGLQCKQQQARAIYRAVQAIVTQRRVMSSDAVVLERWLSRGIWAIHKTIQ